MIIVLGFLAVWLLCMLIIDELILKHKTREISALLRVIDAKQRSIDALYKTLEMKDDVILDLTRTINLKNGVIELKDKAISEQGRTITKYQAAKNVGFE